MSTTADRPSGDRAARVIRLLLAYDGTGFRGWARQPGDRVRTVQGELEGALGRLLGSEPSLAVAGRTDAGVHARGQVASFASSYGGVDLAEARAGVNAMLGPEVVIREIAWASPGFHARFSATAREYRYRIDVGDAPDPFTARFVWWLPKELSLTRMRAGARPLVGEHDFTSFCRRPPDGGPMVRRVDRLTVTRAGDRVEIAIRANAFCHQMVRSVAGMLVRVGEGNLDPEQAVRILGARDRASSRGRLAPAHGLSLERVTYGKRAGSA
jgi:tRNA pseudouridine38-40 synthase